MQTRQTKTAFQLRKVTGTFEKRSPGPSVLEYCALVLYISASSRAHLNDDLSGRNKFKNFHSQLHVYLRDSRTLAIGAQEKILVCNFVTKANSLRSLILTTIAGICCHLTTGEAAPL